MESERGIEEAESVAAGATSVARLPGSTSDGFSLASARSSVGLGSGPRAGRGMVPGSVLALQRTAGNRWVSREVARDRADAARWLLRDTVDAGVSQDGSVSTQTPLAAFTATVARRFGVRDVHVGTQPEQRTLVTPGGALGSAPVTAVLPNWQSWEPDAATYPEIIGAFDDAAAAFGGLPTVNVIVFFDVDYRWDAQSGAFVTQTGTGASFSAGTLTVYRRAHTSPTMLPVARSDRSAHYPNVVLGDKPNDGAPRRYATPAESIRRVIVHELGHGIDESAFGTGATPGPDPKIMADFALAVGWWTAGTGLPRLYDIQDPAVAAALAQQQMPAAAPITPGNWNDPQWHEQPISGYSLTAPFEDFAESVMAYVYAPAVLKARSPARWGFLDGRKAQWKSALRQPTP